MKYLSKNSCGSLIQWENNIGQPGNGKYFKRYLCICVKPHRKPSRNEEQKAWSKFTDDNIEWAPEVLVHTPDQY